MIEHGGTRVPTYLWWPSPVRIEWMNPPSPGPGWWLASDGRWYPPQTPPSTSASPPLGLPPLPMLVPTLATSTQPAQSATPYYPGVAVTGAGYPYPSMPGPAPVEPKTSPMAVWALVLVIVLGALGALVGIPLAFVARSRIRRSGDALKGDGLATAALIVGFVWVGFALLAIAIPTFLGVTRPGPTLAELNYSVQGQIVGTAPNDFDVAGVTSVSCQLPGSWTNGSAFACFVYGTAGSVLGRYEGTVEPNTSDGIYQWNGRYFSST